jgi:hypothetical protein
MRNPEPTPRRRLACILGAACAAAALVAGPALADGDSCREWLREHSDWKARAIARYLGGAPQRDLDTAVFEILQREAYLTSCEMSAQESRAPMVGWRLIDRTPDDYAVAVIDSVLARAGLDPELRDRLGDLGAPEPASAPAAVAGTATHDATERASSSTYARRRAKGVAR